MNGRFWRIKFWSPPKFWPCNADGSEESEKAEKLFEKFPSFDEEWEKVLKNSESRTSFSIKSSWYRRKIRAKNRYLKSLEFEE